MQVIEIQTLKISDMEMSPGPEALTLLLTFWAPLCFLSPPSHRNPKHWRLEGSKTPKLDLSNFEEASLLNWRSQRGRFVPGMGTRLMIACDAKVDLKSDALNITPAHSSPVPLKPKTEESKTPTRQISKKIFVENEVKDGDSSRCSEDWTCMVCDVMTGL